MSDNDRTDGDGDVEFEFFDDPPTREATSTELTELSTGSATPPPEGPRRTVRVRRPPGGSPGIRIALIVGAVVLLVIIIVLAIGACGGGKESEFSEYLGNVDEVAAASQAIGKETTDALLTRGALPSELQAQLQGLQGRQVQQVQRAVELSAPGELAEAHRALIEAMQLRVSGLGGMSQAFEQLSGAATDQEAGELLAEQGSRLTASDVVYEDLFQAPTRTELAADGVTGIPVPDSVFVSSPELYSPSSMTLLVQNLGTGGGGDQATGLLRGSTLVSVIAQPADLQLSPSEPNELIASSDLGFDVLVRNSGDSQETSVDVKLTLQQPGEAPLKLAQTIEVINPDEERVVSFRDLGTPALAVPSTLRIAVTPVPEEANLDNNSAEYEIFISLTD
ncbi:MAG: hypothetical protein ACE5EV_01380 [Gaiellales bacterium]